MIPIDIIFIAFCVYLPILITLQILEIWVVIKPKSNFRSPFYALFVASAICDIIMIVISFPEFRWAIYPIVNGAGMVADGFALFRFYISFVCPQTQDFLNCLIAFNRLIGISKPMGNNSMGTYLWPVSIAFSYMFCLIFCCPLLFRRYFYSAIPMGDYVIYLGATEFASFAPWYKVQMFGIILELSINFITLIFYVRASFLLKRVQISKQNTQDLTLLIFGIAVFAVNIPGLIIQSLMCFNVFAQSALPFIYYNLSWVTDVKCFSSPIIMLIVNDSFRREILRMLRIWKKEAPKPSSSQEIRSFYSSH